MDTAALRFSRHAFERMFARAISPEEVHAVVQAGEVIAEYLDDKPFPSYLLLGFVAGRPLHVVIGYEAAGKMGHIITVYVPDSTIWESDFKTRRCP